MDGATLNEILSKHRDWWPGGLSERQYSVLNLIGQCREKVFGSMQLACKNCGKEQVIPRSCGNRHCPLCQGVKQMEWCEGVCKRLPDIAHFHVVFTLPSEVSDFYRKNFREATALLFEAITETLTQFMRNNWKLEGGFLGVLHTWGQTLMWHPHVHVLVPGGGFRPATGKWVSARANYLFDVKSLSLVFRAIFLRKLEALEQTNDLYHWPLELSTPSRRYAWRAQLSQKKWVIYSRATLGNTRAVVRYLARYTSRIAISNKRLRAVDANEGKVAFDYRDYRDKGRIKSMRLDGREFIGRFAMHIAPRGLRRIRYGGILNSASRYREALASLEKIGEKATTVPRSQCSACGASNWTMRVIYTRVADIWHHSENHRHQAFPLPRSTLWPPRNNRFPLQAGVAPPFLVQLADAAGADQNTPHFFTNSGPADP